MRRQRISRLSVALMGLVTLFFLYWLWEYSNRIYAHVVVNDWASYGGVDDTLQVTWGMRLLASLLYIPVFAVSIATFVFAMGLLNLYRRAVIFELRAARGRILLGLAFVAIAIVDTVVPALEPWFLTQWNAAGGMPPRYFYDSGDITIGLAGLGFVLVGWITREAVLIARENEAFV